MLRCISLFNLVAIFFCFTTVALCASLDTSQDYEDVVYGKLPDKQANDLEYFDKLAKALLDRPNTRDDLLEYLGNGIKSLQYRIDHYEPRYDVYPEGAPITYGMNDYTSLTPISAAKAAADSKKLLNALIKIKRHDTAKKGIVAVVAASLALFGLIKLYRYLYPKKSPKPGCSGMSEPEPEVQQSVFDL